jgi:hypothetical protein
MFLPATVLLLLVVLVQRARARRTPAGVGSAGAKENP